MQDSSPAVMTATARPPADYFIATASPLTPDVSLNSPRSGSLFGKTCFIIMPFGEKSHPVTGVKIDFDHVYKVFIKPAVTQMGLVCVRSDEISKAGLIHRDMIDKILTSDVVIVDITTGNPNVMYELGIRHAAKRWGTIILRHAGHDAIPFNISGLRAIDYDLQDNDAVVHSQRLLDTNIRNCLVERNIDSLVHTLFPGLNVTRRAVPMVERKVFVWSSAKAPRTKICIVWGDIANIDMVDLWVNPENTKMQMGRYHDNSISSYIRYYGAKRNSAGAVVNDRIANVLHKQMRDAHSVEPGTVIVTAPGHLRENNNVMALLHVAAQQGEPGKGYRTIRDARGCISNVLDEADCYNRSLACRLGIRSPARSIIFPLFGTNNPDDDPQLVAHDLIEAVKIYIETWPNFSLDRIYFQAYSDRDDELCVTALNRLGLTYEKSEST